MTLREALRNKRKSVVEMNYKISAWDVCGEDSLILFYADWELKTENIHKLLDYLSFADKLIIALPAGTSDNRIFEVANLQVVDGILVYDDVNSLMAQVPMGKFALEGISIDGLSPEAKARMAAL
jgi:hypothetical protein